MGKLRRMTVLAVVVVGGVVGAVSPALAAGPYFPPNPPPQYVEPGGMNFGHFPLPGLYLGFSEPGQPPAVEREIKVTDDLPAGVGDPVLSPPMADGQPDSYLEAGVKDLDPDHPFVGIATFGVTLCVKAIGIEQICRVYTLVLYVGVPLPAMGAESDRLVATGAAALLLGGGLMVVSRRRRLEPVRVR